MDCSRIQEPKLDWSDSLQQVSLQLFQHETFDIPRMSFLFCPCGQTCLYVLCSTGMSTCAHTHTCAVVTSMWHHILGVSDGHCDWRRSHSAQSAVITCRDIWHDSMAEVGGDMGEVYVHSPAQEGVSHAPVFSSWMNWPLNLSVTDLLRSRQWLSVADKNENMRDWGQILRFLIWEKFILQFSWN